MDLSFENIPSLASLAEISQRLGVRLTIRGGLVRRLVRTAIYEPSELRCRDLLFSLTPFTSDIDIEHSGPPAFNGLLHDELTVAMPAAASVRLELRSEQESAFFWLARRFQAFVPVLSMSLSSDGFHDPDGGALDIEKRKYRFKSNPRYGESPLYLNGKDSAIFSILLYLKAVLEDGANPHDSERLLSDVAGRVEAVRIPDDGYLKARLFYLLAGIWGTSDPKAQRRRLFRQTGLDNFLRSNLFDSNQSAPDDLDSSRALIVSSWLGGKDFRLAKFASRDFFKPVETVDNEWHKHPHTPDNDCFLESPWLKVSQGRSECAVKQTSFGMEFVHLLLELPKEYQALEERELTACWLLRGVSRRDNENQELVFPALTLCHKIKQDENYKLSVRSNLLDLGGLTTEFADVEAKIFLLCPAPA